MTIEKKTRGPRVRHNDPNPIQTGENLRKIRIDRGVTQSELAEALGYKSHCAVTHIENGYRGMTEKRLIQAASFLGVAPSVIRKPVKATK